MPYQHILVDDPRPRVRRIATFGAYRTRKA
jgi:hypothetical protein